MTMGIKILFSVGIMLSGFGIVLEDVRKAVQEGQMSVLTGRILSAVTAFIAAAFLAHFWSVYNG